MSSSQGLDYFNIDVNIFDDAKIINLMNRYGPIGFMSYITILCKVYANGYYLEFSIEDLTQLLIARIGGKYYSGKFKIQEIIIYLAHINLIDKELLNQNVVTSKGIQKRFLKMTKKRQNQDLSKYWIIDQKPEKKEVKEKGKKEALVKEELSKKEIKRRKHVDEVYEHAPKKDYLTSCLISYGYIGEYDLDIPAYNKLFEDLSKEYEQKLLYKSVKYVCEHAKRTPKTIQNHLKFFKTSLENNLSEEEANKKETVMDMFDNLI